MTETYRSIDEWHEHRAEQHDEDDPYELKDTYLRIDLGDGEMYAVVADVVAQHRAAEIAEKKRDGDSDEDRIESIATYQDIRDESMENPECLVKWATENLSWQTIENAAVRISPDGRGMDDRLAEADVDVEVSSADG